MGTNTGAEKVPHFAQICCGDFIPSLYKLFRNSEIDPFNIRVTVNELLIDTFVRCYTGEGPTLLDLLQRHRNLRIRRSDLMEILVGFEDYAYGAKELEGMRYGSLIDVRFRYDSTLMEITYYETVSQEEPLSFSRFVRQLRQNGEEIHPEVDRLLERFRAALDFSSTLQRPSGVSLSRRRSRRARTRVPDL